MDAQCYVQCGHVLQTLLRLCTWTCQSIANISFFKPRCLALDRDIERIDNKLICRATHEFIVPVYHCCICMVQLGESDFFSQTCRFMIELKWVWSIDSSQLLLIHKMFQVYTMASPGYHNSPSAESSALSNDSSDSDCTTYISLFEKSQWCEWSDLLHDHPFLASIQAVELKPFL